MIKIFIISILFLLFSGCSGVKWFPRKADCGCAGVKETCACCNCNTCDIDHEWIQLWSGIEVVEKKF